MSGSPIPRLITSTPAARLAATLRSSSANRYGGMRSRRLLDRMQLLYEFVGERSAIHRNRPAAQIDLQFLPHLDLQLAAVECDRDRRVAPLQDVCDSGARRAGPARGSLPHPALE